jgi:hypothetical protein
MNINAILQIDPPEQLYCPMHLSDLALLSEPLLVIQREQLAPVRADQAVRLDKPQLLLVELEQSLLFRLLRQALLVISFDGRD